MEEYRNGYLSERGLYLFEGSPKLYYALITNADPPTFLKHHLSSERINIVPLDSYELKVYSSPSSFQLVERIIYSYKEREGISSLVSEQSINKLMSNKPYIISASRCSELIKNKKVLIFTGAGVSVTSGVPNMERLEILIQEIFNPEDVFVSDIFSENIAERITKANELISMFTLSVPSRSHWLIAEICHKYDIELVTGNLDGLHEKTGITPSYYTQPLNEVVNLHKYDYILTVGLGDVGMINLHSKYKSCNPEGRIIAINKLTPSYLDSEDFWIEGDCEAELYLLLEGLEKT
jgi:hypothetical protein